MKESEAFRPLLHFTPPANWCNDPNGLVYHNGLYHLFYQYHPDSPVWGPMHWGHAVSRDLLRWEHQPIALFPDGLGTIFSGSAVIDRENTSGFGRDALVACFTHHRDDAESQSLAFSRDGGRTFEKYRGNPVISNPGVRDFRDPKVFRLKQTGLWHMVVSRFDRVQFYASPDLIHWTYTGFFDVPGNPQQGVWECPDLFPLPDGQGGARWVLIVSLNRTMEQGGSRTRYFIGDFDGSVFIAGQKGADMDGGADCYAGNTYENEPKGRRIFLSWAVNPGYAEKVPTRPFRGMMSLPGQLTLKRAGDQLLLARNPLEELKAEAGDTRLLEDGGVLPEGPFQLVAEGNGAFEVCLKNRLGEFLCFGVDGENRIYADRTGAGESGFSPYFARRFSIRRAFDGPCTLRILSDGPLFEVFADDGCACLTLQAYPHMAYSSAVLRRCRAAATNYCVK